MTLSMAAAGSSVGRRWTPLEFGSTALALWLDASDDGSFTLNGSNVSQWNDLSGNARHATQGTDANRPTRQTNVLNGLACVRFDGSNDRMTTGHSFNGYTSFSVYAVMKATNSGGAQSLIRQQPADTSQYFVFPWTNDKILAPRVILQWDGETVTFNLTGTVTSPCILGFLRESGSTNKVRRNGSEENSRSANTVAASMTGNTELGWYANGRPEHYDGDVHEIIIHDGSLSTDNRDRIEGYLAHKWGLTGNLPSDHPYRNTRP